MRVALHEVSKGRALPTTSLEFHSGAVRYAPAETEQRPTVLGLIASGRMKPESGSVTIDAASNPRTLRRTVALVDAPDVSDPHADVTLAGVVGEELMFAGRPATPLHARRWLAQLGYAEIASAPIGTVEPAARVRILCELAVLRDGVEGIVLVSPDRHGGSPDGWWRIAGEFADRGFAMLVILGGSAAVALERMQELGAINASGPIEPLPASATSSLNEPEENPVSTRAAAPSSLNEREGETTPTATSPRSLSEPTSPRSLSERSESKRPHPQETEPEEDSVSTRAATPSSLNEREEEAATPPSLDEREEEAATPEEEAR